MTRTADIIVAGAGHNSLITAAYLAKAGYSVVVLDARPIPGGGGKSSRTATAATLAESCIAGVIVAGLCGAPGARSLPASSRAARITLV